MAIYKLNAEYNDEIKSALFTVIKQAVYAKPNEDVPHCEEIIDLCNWAVYHKLIPAEETSKLCQWINNHNKAVKLAQYDQFII